MGRRWFDDLSGVNLADDDVHTLAVTLDGDVLAAYDVGTTGRSGREDLLADLGEHLASTAVLAPPLDPGPLDQPAEDAPTAAAPIESSLVEGAPADEPLDSTYSVGPVEVGEADRGTATDAQVRAWNELHELGDLRSRRRIPAWLREQYERLDGAEPDDAARRVAARQTSAAGTSAAAEDPPTPDRAGPPGRASGRSNGTHVEPGAEPEPAKPEAPVRPVVEPIGDGTGQPASTPAQLERADELAAEGATPKQICSDTGVWLSEARAAVRKATQR